MFLIIVSELGHPKGVGGVNFQFPPWGRWGLPSNFLRGGGMNVSWNDS